MCETEMDDAEGLVFVGEFVVQVDPNISRVHPADTQLEPSP